MGNIDKYNMGLEYITKYDFKNKEKNLNDYITYMLNRSVTMFKYHNLPDTMPQREIELLLQCNGWGCVCEIDGNLYCLNGGLGGVPNAYNMPTEIIINNPYLNYNKTLTIDTDCVIMPNDSMYIGLLPMYNRYCTMLVENDITMILATVNKRVQNLLSANDDNTVESAKNFLKKVFDGELGVIAESKLFDSLKVNASSVNSTVSMTELFEFEQYVKASLYNEIGLSANYNMKRERLTSAEVETNTDNLYPLVDDMIDQRRKAVEKINEMFGTNIEIEFNSSWDNRPFNGASIHNVEEEVNGSELVTEDVENVGDNVENPDSEVIEDVGKAEERGETETQNDDEKTDETETNDVSEEETTTETEDETNVEKTEDETNVEKTEETEDEKEVETEEETTTETEEETEEKTDEEIEEKTDEETEEEKEDEEKKNV
jgi:hypothetical protein